MLQVEQGIHIFPILSFGLETAETQLHWGKLRGVSWNGADLMGHSTPADAASQLRERDERKGRKKYIKLKSKWKKERKKKKGDQNDANQRKWSKLHQIKYQIEHNRTKSKLAV